MRTKFHILGVALLLLGTTNVARSETTPAFPKLPTDWYVLPERSTHEAASEGDSQKLTEQVDDLFSMHAKALDKIPNALGQQRPPSAPADWAPWHFAAFSTDLTVTAQGTMGVLILKGEPSVTAIWKSKEFPKAQKPKQHAITTEDSTPSSGPVIALNQASTDSELSEQIEPVIKATMATGRVSDESLLRSQLFDAAKSIQMVGSTVPTNPGYTWWVSRLRFDVSVDATGRVSFGYVGGAVRVRLEWFNIQPKASHRPQFVRFMKFNDHALPSDFPAKMAEFVEALSTDLSTISETSLPETDFKAANFRLGLGITAKGTVGIAKGSISMMGYIYFSRDPSAVPKAPQAFEVRRKAHLNHPVYLIETGASEEDLSFARTQGISVQAEKTTHDSKDSVDDVFKLDPEKFREGLNKAMHIAGFFVERANKQKSTKWIISNLKAGFDISIGGTLAVVTVLGKASTEIEFKNMKF